MTASADASKLAAPKAAKALARRSLMGHQSELIELSHDLHRHPELSFEEHRSAAAISSLLEANGLVVKRSPYGLSTAFEASVGSGDLVVGLCAEYDALPGLGHACGHNIIAAIAVGAALSLRHLTGLLDCTVRVLGTPAEERGGGKVLLIERGAFDEVSAAMMVHPAPADALVVEAKACVEVEVELTCRSRRMVEDAATIAEAAIGLARQVLGAGQMLHGIREQPRHGDNFMAHYQLRGDSLADLELVEARLFDCYAAGALAAGAELSVRRTGPAYTTFSHDHAILDLYRQNAETLGRRFLDYPPPVISTDMANVSAMVPSIHPAIGIDSYPAMNHTTGFERAAASPSADRAIHDGACALAWTVVDLALDERERARLRAFSQTQGM